MIACLMLMRASQSQQCRSFKWSIHSQYLQDTISHVTSHTSHDAPIGRTEPRARSTDMRMLPRSDRDRPFNLQVLPTLRHRAVQACRVRRIDKHQGQDDDQLSHVVHCLPSMRARRSEVDASAVWPAQDSSANGCGRNALRTRCAQRRRANGAHGSVESRRATQTGQEARRWRSASFGPADEEQMWRRAAPNGAKGSRFSRRKAPRAMTRGMSVHETHCRAEHDPCSNFT